MDKEKFKFCSSESLHTLPRRNDFPIQKRDNILVIKSLPPQNSNFTLKASLFEEDLPVIIFKWRAQLFSRRDDNLKLTIYWLLLKFSITKVLVWSTYFIYTKKLYCCENLRNLKIVWSELLFVTTGHLFKCFSEKYFCQSWTDIDLIYNVIFVCCRYTLG